MVSLLDLIQETRFRVPTRESLFEDGHWHGPVTMLGWLRSSPATQVGWGPAQPYGPGWAQQNNNNNNNNK